MCIRDSECVAPGSRCLAMGEAQFASKPFPHFRREQGNLAFVILLVIEKAISSDSLPSNAVNLIHFANRVVAGRQSVVTKEIVFWRNEQSINVDHISGRRNY